MKPTGKLEKMLLLSFGDSKAAENGLKPQADAWMELLINPETYTLDYKLEISKVQAPGKDGVQLKYNYTPPKEMSFEFLFDNTGIIDGKPRESIVEDIEKLKKVLIDYKGEAHEPPHCKLVWGEKSVFKGRAIELSIQYKLFNADGTPIRAIAKVKFLESIEEKKNEALKDKKSADLTHVKTVKAGDTLPLLCYQIYQDPRYYLQVAQANQLDNFRSLPIGLKLFFPPLTDKSVN